MKKVLFILPSILRVLVLNLSIAPQGITILIGRNLGLLDIREAKKDFKLSEEFTKAGIRTCRVAAIIKLEEIIHNGKKITIDEARKLEIIDPDFQPVIEVRCFRIKARVKDVLPEGGLSEKR